jgi:hypothetical protein
MIGTIANGGTVTASVTAQAVEDGATTNTASATSTSPDPNTSNNTASVNTSFAETSINVSPPIRTRQMVLTNFQTATFTHANAVEPVSAFAATINWGDSTTSAGTISLSGTTYRVTGSHTYSTGGKHTITTTVVETGSSPNGGDKFGDDHPGGDVVQYKPPSDDDNGGGTDAPAWGFLPFVFGDDHHEWEPIVQPPSYSGQRTVMTNTPVLVVLAHTESGSKGNFDASAATIPSSSHSAQQSLFAHPTAGTPLPEDWLADFWSTS